MRDHYSDMDNSRNCHTSNFVDSEKNSTQNSLSSTILRI